MHFIYRITNLINQKIYIGQTNYPARRWSQHKHAAKTNSQELIVTRAMSKYGFNNFIFEVIATCRTQDDANYAEEIIIKQYDSRNLNKGYNIKPGGDTSSPSDETRKKISEGRKRFFKDNFGSNKGVPLTEEHRKNISKASFGKPGTNKGKKFSDEWRQKIAIANTGKTPTPETLIKLSESHKGKIAPNRKLTFEQAEEIRELYKLGEMDQHQLSEKYGISQACINSIISYKTYKK